MEINWNFPLIRFRAGYVVVVIVINPLFGRLSRCPCRPRLYQYPCSCGWLFPPARFLVFVFDFGFLFLPHFMFIHLVYRHLRLLRLLPSVLKQGQRSTSRTNPCRLVLIAFNLNFWLGFGLNSMVTGCKLLSYIRSNKAQGFRNSL